MPRTLRVAPTSGGTGMSRFGGSSNLNAIETNDGNTSYLYTEDSFDSISVGFDYGDNPFIPDDATVTQLTIGAVMRVVGGGASATGSVGLPNASNSGALSGSFAPITATQTTSVPQSSVNASVVFSSNTGEARVTQVYLDVTFNSLPYAPTNLSPANGGTVITQTPTYSGTRVDPDNDTMTAYQIEVRRNSDNVLMWDSGEQTSGISGVNFSRIHGGTALSNGVEYKWRARTKEAAGWGTWSSYRTFTVQLNTTPTASLSTPADGAQVGTLTPTLGIVISDPDSGTLGEFAHYQLVVERVSDGATMWDTGQRATSSGEKTARAATPVYGSFGSPTTLVVSTPYRVRGRVWDGVGAVSEYTAYRTFTPVLAPNAPTLTSPSGLTDTLTPTIQGTYEQGSGGTEAAFQYKVRQGATTVIYESGDVAVAIATGQAYGTDNASDTPSSPPALAWGTQYYVAARSKDAEGDYSDWTDWVAFNTNAAPTTPTLLSPADGAVTGDTTPTLAAQHNDPDGDAQTKIRFYLRELGGSFVSGYDPKELSQATGSHDVTETLDDSPQDYEWWVETLGTAGPGWSPASDHRTFTVATVPVLTIVEPDPDEVLGAPSFTVEWTFTGGSGTQGDYRIRIYADDQTTVIYDSGVTASTDTEHTVPSSAGLRDGNTYYVRITVRDDLEQSADSGFIRVTADWIPPAQIAGFTATFIGGQ